MIDVYVRDATEYDFRRVVELNLAEVAHTSAMNMADVARLHSLSAYHRVLVVEESVAGFLLVMGPNSDYINDNYVWFKHHLANYMYIDRIVLDARYQGRQLGSVLYQDLFTWSKAKGVYHVVCEYNLEPLNQPSAKFHQRLGFKQLGYQWLPLNKSSSLAAFDNKKVSVLTHKKVSMQCCDLSHTQVTLPC
ncbi:hypothetical protein FX988_00521 [Paraglaciecola mesophila]|uniref:N-acetyltransferase domain-containing protein n=1 Tax=Paraglaciecola mesophila TaxID=197222 RepID=A0A857JE48_9ALTE|nr:GNAT family N-acetyltransferase [Paraglaciecola mesophila]QHJ10309.1 hypothetical protein FX988_00521 [Paraglaciecola mesophila]